MDGVHSHDLRSCDKKIYMIYTNIHTILILKQLLNTRGSIWFLETWITVVTNLFQAFLNVQIDVFIKYILY